MSVKPYVVILLTGVLSACQQTAEPVKASLGDGWQLVWQDEFSQNTLDLAKWQHEVNCRGGCNDEQQCYTARSENSFVKNGLLHIVGFKDAGRLP